MVAAVAGPDVVSNLRSVYVMLHLLGDHGKMCGLIELISSATVFMRVMIFQRQSRVGRRTHECAGTEGLGLQLRHFRVSVSVMVVSVAIPALTVNKDSRLIVVGDDRGIQRRVIVERP